ncbi:MAG TPA: helix-turn-helix domain-containing protein [Actinomycetota bacterium]|jgi:AcrR family transcriptional regulator|nr:helix-turn-helix domain-containing protein [Actinomycetota bacterium]
MAEGTTTRRRELPEVRREQILDAAARVFLDRGLAEATMADVAEAAGVAKGTVYLYFDSKSALLTALRARYTSQWLAQSGRLDAPAGRGGHARQLRAFLGEMYDFHAANQRLHHLLFHAAEVSEDEPLDQARAALVRFVARGAEAGEFTVEDPELTASFLLDGLHGLLLRSLHADRSRRAFVAAAWSLCAGVLRLTG